ncbi:MAG: NUDIX domain-containing protein [Gordonia sp. (in: high G+C Gram-positive bacteria)]
MTEHPTTVPLRDAATVVLLRDGEQGIEVFLQRRVAQMAFAGGMTVFPGGGVDPRDADADFSWTGPDVSWWADHFSATPALARSLVAAAVRETFEECGVLLASAGDAGVVGATTGFAADRAALVDKSLSLAGFLRQHDLTLRADLLRPLARWITPVTEPRRYDTRFFLAAVPDGQTADDATTEAADVSWLTPAAALRAWESGEHFLLPPTWTQLRELLAYDTVAAALAAERTIRPFQPEVASSGAGILGLRFAGYDDYVAALADGRLERLRGGS